MKKVTRAGYLPLLFALVFATLTLMPILSFASQPAKVELGSTVTYAVLAGSTITNTGPTVITGGLPEGGGNIGVHPGLAITGLAEITMTGWTAHQGDAAAGIAKDDLQTAYNDAAGRTFDSDLSGQDLGNLTLTAGVYSFSSSAQLTGTLTLDAQGDPNSVFIFQIGSTLTTASNSHVNLINSARFCRVFWQVGSSATLGTYSDFAGHIFAQASITAATGATVQGQLLALTGAVTLDTNTINNALCNEIETTTEETTTEETTAGETTTEETTTEETTAEETTTEVTTTEETTAEETTTEVTTTEETTAEETTTEETTAEETTAEETTAEETTTEVTTTEETTAEETTTVEATTEEATTEENTTGEATTGEATTAQATTGETTTGEVTMGETTTGEVTMGETTTGEATTAVTAGTIPQTGRNGSLELLVVLVLTSSLILAGATFAMRKKQISL